jgi:peptide methionine sulfoxide reductase MsrB
MEANEKRRKCISAFAPTRLAASRTLLILQCSEGDAGTARYMQNKSGTGSRAPAYPLMAGSANGKPRGCGWGSFINPVEHRKIKDV